MLELHRLPLLHDTAKRVLDRRADRRRPQLPVHPPEDRLRRALVESHAFGVDLEHPEFGVQHDEAFAHGVEHLLAPPLRPGSALLRAHGCGGVETLDEHAGDGPVGPDDRLVDEVEVVPLRWPVSGRRHVERHAMCDEALARCENRVEPVHQTLRPDFRECFAHIAPD